MPPAVRHLDARREGQYSLLQLALPGRPVHNIGILLLDPSAGKLYSKLRSDWEDIAPAEELDFLSALEADFQNQISERGGAGFLAWLEDTLSNVLLLSERVPVPVDSFHRVLEQLFARHVAPLAVEPYRTHLPLYSLRAAATRFGDDQQVEEEDWVPVPRRLRPNPNLFVAHVSGRSMEPRIPDGSLNIFRVPVVGSRQNKIVLVEMFGALDDSARYSIKRYTSRKVRTPEGEWRHASIRLEPLNPEFAAFELEEGGFRVIAEWIATLE